MAEVILHRIVAKHGSHNQKDHARGKGGVAGSGAVDDAKEDLQNRADGARAARRSTDISPTGEKRLQGAEAGFEQAKNSVGAPDKMQALARIYPKPTAAMNLTPFQTGFHEAIQSAVADYGNLQA